MNREKMKIYFAVNITGASAEDKALHKRLFEVLRKHGHVLTEFFVSGEVETEEKGLTDRQVHEKDMKMLKEADVVVAEVTRPSLGVGFELGRVIEWGQKRILCIFRPEPGIELSRMIAGADNGTSFIVKHYKEEEADDIFREFFAAA